MLPAERYRTRKSVCLCVDTGVDKANLNDKQEEEK